MVMLAMVTLAVNTFREVITEYVSRPTDVVTRLERESDLAFPAVTLCNINPSRSSLISDHSGLASALTSQAKVRRKRNKRDSSCSFSNKSTGKFSTRNIYKLYIASKLFTYESCILMYPLAMLY